MSGFTSLIDHDLRRRPRGPRIQNYHTRSTLPACRTSLGRPFGLLKIHPDVGLFFSKTPLLPDVPEPSVSSPSRSPVNFSGSAAVAKPQKFSLPGTFQRVQLLGSPPLARPFPRKPPFKSSSALFLSKSFSPPKVFPPWKNSGPAGGENFCMDTVAASARSAGVLNRRVRERSLF